MREARQEESSPNSLRQRHGNNTRNNSTNTVSSELPHASTSRTRDNCFLLACSVFGAVWFLLSVAIFILGGIYSYSSCICNADISVLKEYNSKLQNDLRMCDERYDKERDISEQRVDGIIDITEECALVKMDLASCTTERFYLILIILFFVLLFGLVLYCFCRQICRRNYYDHRQLVLSTKHL